MINKWMAKIKGKEAYNIRGPPGMGIEKKEKLKEDGCCSCHPRKLLQLSIEEPRRRLNPRMLPPMCLIIPSTYNYVRLLQPSLKPSSWVHSLPNLLYWTRWVWAYSLNSRSTQTPTLQYVFVTFYLSVKFYYSKKNFRQS